MASGLALESMMKSSSCLHCQASSEQVHKSSIKPALEAELQLSARRQVVEMRGVSGRAACDGW